MDRAILDLEISSTLVEEIEQSKIALILLSKAFRKRFRKAKKGDWVEAHLTFEDNTDYESANQNVKILYQYLQNIVTEDEKNFKLVLVHRSCCYIIGKNICLGCKHFSHCNTSESE